MKPRLLRGFLIEWNEVARMQDIGSNGLSSNHFPLTSLLCEIGQVTSVYSFSHNRCNGKRRAPNSCDSPEGLVDNTFQAF